MECRRSVISVDGTRVRFETQPVTLTNKELRNVSQSAGSRVIKVASERGGGAVLLWHFRISFATKLLNLQLRSF
ncbi:hypothetical protein SRHO_G00280330 [Serrasalmus rhombeus]